MDTNQVPQTFDDCIKNAKSDWLAQELWHWAERLKKIGLVLFWILIACGIIVSIVSSLVLAESYRDEISFNLTVFLTTIITYALYAFLEFCFYHILSLLLHAASNIVMNVSLTADLAMLNSQKDGYESYKSMVSKPKHTTYEE